MWVEELAYPLFFNHQKTRVMTKKEKDKFDREMDWEGRYRYIQDRIKEINNDEKDIGKANESIQAFLDGYEKELVMTMERMEALNEVYKHCSFIIGQLARWLVDGDLEHILEEDYQYTKFERIE